MHISPSGDVDTLCLACRITSLGCRRQGTKGRCRVGGATHPSPRSASTAAAAAGACSRSPGWWNAST
eukprot:204776-Pleurochrysis_carterae.AAC.1